MISFQDLLSLRTFQWHTLENFILDENNQSLVDEIIKIEDIDNGIKKTFKIGLSISDIPKINSTNHKNYRQYYNDATKN